MGVADSANNAAVFLQELGRYDEAQASFHRAHAIYARIFGEDSGKIGLVELNESETLAALGRFKEARAAIKGAKSR